MFKITMFPAEDGDSFFIETGEPSSTHRILVDGGRSRTASDIIWPFIQSMPARRGPVIDLVVLTHIDADHIEGLLTLLTRKDSPSVGEIWFNDYAQLREASCKPPLPRARSDRRQTSSVEVLGVKQAEAFADAISRNRWPLNAAFNGGPVMVEASGSLPVVELASGAKLTLLGPTRAKLAVFESAWEKELAKFDRERVEVLAERKRPHPVPGRVEQIARQRDDPDTAKPNGSSIAFVLEYRQRRALFLADAHPDDMMHNVIRYGDSGGRVCFDVVKVAHHGSAANNTSTLINSLESSRWLVSSNGSRHHHPDPECISRIILAPVQGKKLIFNYRSTFNEVWDTKSLSEIYQYRAIYATSWMPISIELVD